MPTTENILAHLGRAADDGQDLDAATSLRITVALGFDALTVGAITQGGKPELVWCDPAEGPGVQLDDLQYTLGDGPTTEAARLGRTVIEPDLASADPARWPLFLPATVPALTGAVIAAPLRLDGEMVGVLTGYRATPGALIASQTRDFHRVRLALLPLLLHSAQSLSAAGSAPGHGLHYYREEVQQAAGFLAHSLAIPIDQALARLRALAFRHNRPLTDLARDALAHRLQLDEDNR